MMMAERQRVDVDVDRVTEVLVAATGGVVRYRLVHDRLRTWVCVCV